MESLIKAHLDEAYPDQVVKVGVTLFEEKQVQFINFLRKNSKVFVGLQRRHAENRPRHGLTLLEHLSRGSASEGKASQVCL